MSVMHHCRTKSCRVCKEIIEGAGFHELDQIFISRLNCEYEAVGRFYRQDAIPSHEETQCLCENLVAIIEEWIEAEKVFPELKRDRFSRMVLRNWRDIIKVIEKRMFRNSASNNVLVRVEEVDYLHMDAMYALKIGMYLPSIDFDVAAGLGYYLSGQQSFTLP